MKDRKQKAFGLIMIYLLSVANGFNLLWTWWLVKEQIQTGWGYGTNMDILVLVPWIIQLACVPVVIATITYFVFVVVKGIKEKAVIANIVLLSVLLIQSVLIHLFIWR